MDYFHYLIKCAHLFLSNSLYLFIYFFQKSIPYPLEYSLMNIVSLFFSRNSYPQRQKKKKKLVLSFSFSIIHHPLWSVFVYTSKNMHILRVAGKRYVEDIGELRVCRADDKGVFSSPWKIMWYVRVHRWREESAQML